jgi:hypothetical protein
MKSIVALEDQWNRFVEDVPAHEPPVLSRVHFEEWGQRGRTPRLTDSGCTGMTRPSNATTAHYTSV